MLQIGGVTPYSAMDYPGCFSAVIFCQGCAWRCRYCHNSHLQSVDAPAAWTWEKVLTFLDRRHGLLDAVVFSGGEPTLQKGLSESALQIKAMGFKVGLHTAGMYPDRLRELLPLFDWVGMDIKAPFAEYAPITGVADSGEKARASAQAILDSGVEHEFRTTVHSSLLSPDALDTLAQELVAMGAQQYVLQEFRPQGCGEALPRTIHGYLQQDKIGHIAERFERFSVRGA